MRRSFPVRVAMVGLLTAIGALVVFTTAVYPPSSEQPKAGGAPAPSALVSQAADEEEPGQRLPAGAAIPLTLDQETRDQLSAAARAAVDPSGPAKGAVDVATSGTIYYGEIYGKTLETDMYYVVASIDQLYFWKRKGGAAWEFQGGYDARVCEPAPPPIPRELTRAWGEDPGGTGLC